MAAARDIDLSRWQAIQMIYSFGNFRLDASRRELERAGHALKLRPKVFEVLLLLLQNHDRVVSREEMLESVWPGRYISDTTLSSCIKELRRALSDTDRQNRLIQTVHGAGFRFLAGVVELESPQKPTANNSAIASYATGSTNGEFATQQVGPAYTTLSTADVERKNVSAIRCAISAADHLADTLGPEELHTVMQDLFKLSQATVERHEGQVTQWLSDGFLALFGVPLAREDHARRALSAAMELRDSADEQWRESEVRLQIALTSGSVIVGSVPGQPKQCFTASGKVMRLAETLCQSAEPGCIVASRDSYELLVADIRARKLSCEAWEIERFEQTYAGVPRRFRRDFTSLVGRDWEMSLLLQQLDKTLDTEGQAITVSGQPGIGKSRLLNEFSNRAVEQGIPCIRLHCFAQSKDTPFFLAAEYLRHHCDISIDETAAIARQKLEAVLDFAGLEKRDCLPLLMQALNLQHDPEWTMRAANRRQREQTLDILLQLFLSRPDPVILLVEDLHWADDSSALWLTACVRQLRKRPILVIVSVRQGHEAEWFSLPWTTRLTLAPLTSNYCRELLYNLPLATRLKESVPELVERSGGNPFYLCELALNSFVADQAIPDTIRGVLAARIDQQLPLDKYLLQLAAIVGQCGPISLLVALSNLPITEVNGCMLRLQAAELLYTDYDNGHQRFAFRHSLIQEATYSNQLDSHRREIHARVALVTREQFASLCAQQPEFMAHHHAGAGEFMRAARYWQRSALIALRRSAYVESMAYVRHGLEALAELEKSTRGAAIELALQKCLGNAQVATHGYGSAEVLKTWQTALSLCEYLQDRASLFRILAGLCNYHLVRCEFAQAFKCNRQMLQLARRQNDSSLKIVAIAARGELLMHYGRSDLARQYFDKCHALSGSNAQLRQFSLGAVITAAAQTSWIYKQLEQTEIAQTHARRAVELARQLAQPFRLSVALTLSAEFHRLCEDSEKAGKLAAEAAILAEQQAFPYWHGCALITLGWAEAHDGNSTAGLHKIQKGLKIYRSTGASLQISSHLEGLADAYRMAGDLAHAARTTKEGIRWAERTGDKYRLPRLQRLQLQIGA